MIEFRRRQQSESSVAHRLVLN